MPTGMDLVKDFVILVLGVGASWLASRWYYQKAGNELRDEAAKLRQLVEASIARGDVNIALHQNRHNPGAKPGPDNTTAIIPATGVAVGGSKATAVSSKQQS